MANTPEINPSDWLGALTPEIYERFREAIAIGRWPNGVPLTDEQRSTCLQAIIVYEKANVPEAQRTGYVPPKDDPCKTDMKPEQDRPITWK